MARLRRIRGTSKYEKYVKVDLKVCDKVVESHRPKVGRWQVMETYVNIRMDELWTSNLATRVQIPVSRVF